MITAAGVSPRQAIPPGSIGGVLEINVIWR